jgi:phenylpropionate dioxygenase-like ring-hydroxylating dioxygenase large terminal subunit
MKKLKLGHPRILTYKNVFKNANFFGSSNFVINQNLELFPNRCPHRGNKIIKPGTTKDLFQCNLHGWQWNNNGQPINNNVSLKSQQATLGESGLVFLNWDEPQGVQWVEDLKNSTFEYSHSLHKQGFGDWRWQMEMHVDLLHVEKIHPLLHSYVDCTKLRTERGNDWIAQYHDHGWWLFIYPFTHIEWEPGCFYFSEMTPKENDQGYDVYIHYYFDQQVDSVKRQEFAKMADQTFDEDIQAVNELSSASSYRMPSNCQHPLEQDIIHFYNWLKEGQNDI